MEMMILLTLNQKRGGESFEYDPPGEGTGSREGWRERRKIVI